MQYIQLSNDSYVLYLSNELKRVSRTSFNYHKIQKLVKKGASEAEILPLLEVPHLPDGTYEAYKANTTTMLYLHTMVDGIQRLRILHNDRLQDMTRLEEKDVEYMGIYASLEDLMEDWPEFLL